MYLLTLSKTKPGYDHLYGEFYEHICAWFVIENSEWIKMRIRRCFAVTYWRISSILWWFWWNYIIFDGICIFFGSIWVTGWNAINRLSGALMIGSEFIITRLARLLWWANWELWLSFMWDFKGHASFEFRIISSYNFKCEKSRIDYV